MSVIKDPVNLSLGDKVSAYAGRKTRTTHDNSIWVKIDPPNEHFRSEVPFWLMNHLPGTRMIIAPDGIGTKVALIDAAFGYKNAAYDLLAMTAGDITRSGGCPVVFSNVLDVSSIGESETSPEYSAIMDLFDGLVDVSNKLKIACVKGETAELSACVSSPNPNAILKFNWAGFMIGVIHPDKRITGETLAPGQVVIALREYSPRSNGVSFIRMVAEKHFGPDWWGNTDFVKKIAMPSTLYDHFLADLNGWYNIKNDFYSNIKPHLICHLSGGSFKAKLFEDVLKRKGLSANLNDLWEPPYVIKELAEWSEISDERLYEKWNCGQGVLVVVNKEDVNSFLYKAIDFGIEAKVAGEIYEHSTPKLSITSKFSGKIFEYK